MKLTFKLILFFLSTTFVVQTKAQNDMAHTYEKGEAAYRSENYSDALEIFLNLSEKKNDKASYALGVMFLNGQGVSKDTDKAIKFFKNSASLGNLKAMHTLGEMYSGSYRSVVEKNEFEAFNWFLMCAKLGSSVCQLEVAKKYRDGEGIPKSDQNAMSWFQKSGDSGEPEGYEEAALLYRHSKQLKRNNKKAIELYKKAASGGSDSAMNNIASIYYNGDHDVKKNNMEAYFWIDLAFDRRPYLHQEFRNHLLTSLSADELASVNERKKKWLSDNE